MNQQYEETMMLSSQLDEATALEADMMATNEPTQEEIADMCAEFREHWPPHRFRSSPVDVHRGRVRTDHRRTETVK